MNESKRAGRIILIATLAILLCVAVLIEMKRKEEKGERLALPAASEVTVCYYIPDLTRPYEQKWLGGEKLEAVLAELAETEFTEAEEDPDEGTFRAALVVATNEEQITVHVDEDGACWVWMEIKGWMKGEDHETQKD